MVEVNRSALVSRGRLIATFLSALLYSGFSSPFVAADEREADVAASNVEGRLLSTIGYLAADAREGRGIGTKGLDQAADYLARQFAAAGLNTKLFDGSPFQQFEVTANAALGPQENNHLLLIGTDSEGQTKQVDFQLGESFNTLAVGGSNVFDLPLVFVGYGITAKDLHYDDYAGIDVDGKAVIILRKEPQQDDEESPFDGVKNTSHASFSSKIANAYGHGAAAVILVNDDFGVKAAGKTTRKTLRATIDRLISEDSDFRLLGVPTAEQQDEYLQRLGKMAGQIQDQVASYSDDPDVLLGFEGAGTDSGHPKLPVVFCRRAEINKVLTDGMGVELAVIEARIDRDLKPASKELTAWRATGQTDVFRQQVSVKNVIAVLEGEGPLADETVIVGAHYDHLGFGGAGSFVRGRKEIHNGADDNASGTAVLLELARQMAARPNKLPRRLVFIAFTAEERGLIGSTHYVKNPLFPLDKTVAMINMDMVGRLDKNSLIVHGTGTATEFDAWLDRSNEKHEFKLTRKPGGFGPSDHTTFYSEKIPVFHFFTGTHSDYHRPSDDIDKVNIPGMRRVGEMVSDIVIEAATAPERPHYLETKAPAVANSGSRPYFGSIPDFASGAEGYSLMGVTKASPADLAGIEKGDIITQFGDLKIAGLEDFHNGLLKFKPGEQVKVTVSRDGKAHTFTVILGTPK